METSMDDITISALKDFFTQTPLPGQVELYPGTRIVDIPLFLKTQFNIIENGSSVVRRPAYERLLQLKQLLSL